ncbi:MAG: hypothetical protein H6728_17555 [Myxococcales bacterium]|nr:hypothetical protein [Myxococcales bacterium]
MRFLKSGLMICPSCSNHVKQQDAAEHCPFCGSSFQAPSNGPANNISKRKLGILGASLVSVAAMVACVTPPAPAYGVPVENPTEKSAEQTTDGGVQDTLPAPAYGVPAPTDGGNQD